MDLKIIDETAKKEQYIWSDFLDRLEPIKTKLGNEIMEDNAGGVVSLKTLFDSIDSMAVWKDLSESYTGHYYFALFPAFRTAIETVFWVSSMHLAALQAGDAAKQSEYATDLGTVVDNFEVLSKWANKAYDKMTAYYSPTLTLGRSIFNYNKRLITGEKDKCLILAYCDYCDFDEWVVATFVGAEPTCGRSTCENNNRPCDLSYMTCSNFKAVEQKLLKDTYNDYFIKTKWTKAVDDWANHFKTLQRQCKSVSKVSIASDGTAFALGVGTVSGNTKALYKAVSNPFDTTNKWTYVYCCFNDISVASSSKIWLIADNNDIYSCKIYFNTADCTQLSHYGFNNWLQISAALDGTVFALNSDTCIYKLTRHVFPNTHESEWTKGACNLIQISVGSASKIWGVGNNNDIYSCKNADCTELSHYGYNNWLQISAASDGTVFALHSDTCIYKLTRPVFPKTYESEWTKGACNFKRISGGSASMLWAVGNNDEAYTCSGACSTVAHIHYGPFCSHKYGFPSSAKVVSVNPDLEWTENINNKMSDLSEDTMANGIRIGIWYYALIGLIGLSTVGLTISTIYIAYRECNGYGYGYGFALREDEKV